MVSPCSLLRILLNLKASKNNSSNGTYRISEDVRNDGWAAIERATKDLKRDTDGDAYHIIRKKGSTLGTYSAKDSSIDRYALV
jgi:hypothetical protein